jgi:hypothetical protein
VNGDGTVILDVGQKTVVNSQNAALATILILLGLIQVFFGFRLIRITLVITGFISWGKLHNLCGKGRGEGRRQEELEMGVN